MKLFKLNVDYGQFIYAAENKQQLIDYLKETNDYNICRYDSNIGFYDYMSDEEISKMIVEVYIPKNGVRLIGGYQE